MNKKFYFALALTAGLFASCSSDDLTAEAPQQSLEINDNEAAQITIGVDGIQSYTRGTGSIMGKTWGGQQFEIFMFKKGTFDPATYKETEASPEVPIFNNDTLTTGKGDSKAAYIVGGTEKFNYFPSTGQFDFWAYRGDDAGGVPTPNAAGDILQVPFEINGTQDLMIAITDTAKAAQALMAAQPTKFATEEEALTKIYSAYSARRGVNPKLKFSHLLTRLTFEVKAATRDVSTAASLKTTDPTEQQGFTITKVTVWSKSKGNINVAYTQGIPADAERVEWDATELWNDTTTLADFQLMSRDSEIEKADIVMVPVNKDYRGATNTLAGVPAGYTLTVANIVDGTNCYTSAALDATTGELLPANITTFVAAAASPVYIPAVKDGDHGDGDATTVPATPGTPWNLHIVKEDASAKLKALVPVVPEWVGFNDAAGWSVLVKKPVADGFTWTHIGNDAAGAAAAAAAPYNIAPADIATAEGAPVAAAPTATTEGTDGQLVCYNNFGIVEYYVLTAIAYNTAAAVAYAGANDPITDNAAGADGQIVYTGTLGVDEVYYSYHIAGTIASEGNAVATPIGESMLVAPADDNGYWVEFTYTRTKKITDARVEPMVGTGLINVKTAAGKQFEAGKTYKVTAILYSDGEINVEDILDTDGEGPVDDYVDQTGDLDDGNGGNGYGIGDE